MKYTGTRSAASVSAASAILSGIAPDGGLYLPGDFPRLSLSQIAAMCSMGYPERAARIMGLFLEDFTPEELLSYARAAYSAGNFGEKAAPLVRVSDTAFVLELFHGPTCAFKDFALQMLPRLLTASAGKNGVREEIAVLTATSGDTGKAALEGFADVPGTKICVFYPRGGTSAIQRLQMTTQSGENVLVTAVNGSFDDAQSGVKDIFTDPDYKALLLSRNMRLSSANSINWGRIVPQAAYYFSAYCDMINSGAVSPGDPVNAAVPTGNFGNILSAFIAKRCGLPLRRLICASNRNNVLADFIATGVYDRRRPLYRTASPSMDILVSSNLERLLYLLSGSCEEVKGYMRSLADEGRYKVTPELHRAIRDEFSCGCADDGMAADTIKSVFEGSRYLADPHTAVALNVYEAYRRATGDNTPTIAAATASPFKFAGSVLKALGRDTRGGEFELLDRLGDISGLTPPRRLTDLKGRAERFTGSIGPKDMRGFILAGFVQ